MAGKTEGEMERIKAEVTKRMKSSDLYKKFEKFHSDNKKFMSDYEGASKEAKVEMKTKYDQIMEKQQEFSDLWNQEVKRISAEVEKGGGKEENLPTFGSSK